MAAEYAPAELLWLAREICAAIPSAQLAGVIGDSSHRYGYHRARAVVSSSDYSAQLSADREGDKWAASALDIKLNSTWMKTITGRLMKSARDQNDPRLNYCREFYGTLNGSVVAGWDTYYGRSATSDSSHLWHVHISFLRKHATSRTAAEAVLSVIKGEDYATMAISDADARKIADYVLSNDSVMASPPPVANDDFPDNETWQLKYGVGTAAHHARLAARWGDIINAALPPLRTDVLSAIQSAAAEILAAIQGKLNGFRDELVAGLGPAVTAAVREQIGTITEQALAEASKSALRQVLGGLDNAAIRTDPQTPQS